MCKWADGTGCTAGIPTLAREAHQTKKTTIGHLKTLMDAGLISRKRRVETTPTVSVETTLSSQRPCLQVLYNTGNVKHTGWEWGVGIGGV